MADEVAITGVALALLACLKILPMISDLFSNVLAVARLELLLLLLLPVLLLSAEEEEEDDELDVDTARAPPAAPCGRTPLPAATPALTSGSGSGSTSPSQLRVPKS